jgi:hypothetical protein
MWLVSPGGGEEAPATTSGDDVEDREQGER